MQDTLQQPIPAESLGQWFAHARMDNQLEQQEVARHLRLNVKVIQAIETDEFQQLGPPVFVRGYLSRYAELLGIPERRILDRYKQLGVDEPPPLRVASGMKSQSGPRTIRWLAYPLVLALIAWLGWLGLGQVASYLDLSDMDMASTSNEDTEIALPPRETPAPEQDEGVATETDAVPANSPTDEPAPVAAVSGSEEPSVATPDADEPASENALASTDPTGVQPEDDTLIVPVEPAEAVTPGADETAAGNGPPQLVLAFSEDCWVDVKDADGEVLLYGVKKSGSTHTVSGPAPFSLAFGNAPGVNITLNGNPVARDSYVPKRGSVSRFVLEAPPSD